MKKKNLKMSTCILSAVLILGMFGAQVMASSWDVNLKRWSGASEISEMKKTSDVKNYYMEVSYVGAHYDSVEHWIESDITGTNYSVHSITKEGKNNSPASTAKKGDEVVLNVKNPISVEVKVEASGAWSAN